MIDINKQKLTETDVRTKFITPSISKAGWDKMHQLREEVQITDGRIIARSKLAVRSKPKRVDYLLNYHPNLPLAIVEAKDNSHSMDAGLQQVINYGEMLDVPFVYSSNGKGFIEHDFFKGTERQLTMEEFPSPEELWHRYRVHKGLVNNEEKEELIKESYFFERGQKNPRYYQRVAINRTIEAISEGKKRLLLIMATGTGKTYTSFQIIWRAWKAGKVKKVLYLADRNILIDQTMSNDFSPLANVMTKIENKKLDSSFEIYMSLYHQLTGDNGKEAFRDFKPDFFDLIVVDEAHRGSARDDSRWRDILDYFDSAIQLGMTATPKADVNVNTFNYFGNPLYTYSLKQGIDDGFLAPYKVVRVSLDRDLEGYRPNKDEEDIYGRKLDDKIYMGADFDRKLVLQKRTRLVAEKITEFMKKNDRMSKTIVFCVDIDHAERMRRELVNLNADMVKEDSRYIMKITGDDIEGKSQLDNFIDVDSPYPTIVTTSKLLTTGVDAKTVKLIVLDTNIASVSEFKQIIGRGTRLREDYDKTHFTIMDFRNATNLFADPLFDGPPEAEVDVDGEKEMPGEEEIVDAESETNDENTTDKEQDKVPPAPSTGDELNEGYVKYYVDHVTVRVLNETVYYYNKDGDLVSEGIKDYTRKTVTDEYATMDEFIKRWNQENKKQAVVEELKNQGLLIEELEEHYGDQYDEFDLILHVAYGQKMMTRSQRAKKLKESKLLNEYSGVARKVIDALIDKYKDEGYSDFDDIQILKLDPFNHFGNPKEIAQAFGGKKEYLEVMKSLEDTIYA